MSNDYEYLGDSQQVPPPVAPRPPTDAPPDLLTGLPNTPALKSNDDVDLESNRPRGNNNLSFSDGLNPKRSEPSVATTKTSRSTESDEESKKGSNKEEERKPQKCGTCWCIFAGITIFLAVISLLGLGAFLLMNVDSTEDKSMRVLIIRFISIRLIFRSEALNATNETSPVPLVTTTVLSTRVSSTKYVPMAIQNTNSTPSSLTSTVSVPEQSTIIVSTTDAGLNESTRTSTSFPDTTTTSILTESTSQEVSTFPTVKIEDAVPVVMTTTSETTVEVSTLPNMTDSEPTKSTDDFPTTNTSFTTLASTESNLNATTTVN
ncbi:hypothetical protein B9Z55_002008 [Caenorhabditis nigoni]|uniref:Uncharacterized protein n=1 Tax=Caenorhabditis nigoni TaxID=1611254 RepID=A0A2G5VIE0_9PELO|nr:hypothetical protein B9Z55_002008 [Caenorhabditis nigoni]